MSNTQPLDEVKQYIKNKGLKAPLIIALAALVVGVMLGGLLFGGSSKSSSAKADKPVAAVTSTPQPAVTQVVEKSSVPKECLDALDEADRGFDLASDMSSEFRDAITAIQLSDVDGMNTATKHIQKINSSLGTLSPQYNADKLICRAAGE